MKESNIFDDPFVDSLKQLATDVPAETKSRLLYECGMAAAATQMRNQRRNHLASTVLVLLVASGVGFFLGHQFSQPNQPVAVIENSPTVEELPARMPERNFVYKKNTTTLAAAMPFNRVMELLDRTSDAEQSLHSGLEQTNKKPLSTISLFRDLE